MLGVDSRRIEMKDDGAGRSFRLRVEGPFPNFPVFDIRESWTLGSLWPAPTQTDQLASRPTGGPAEGDLSPRGQGRGRPVSRFPRGSGIQSGHRSALRQFGETPQAAGKARARASDARLPDTCQAHPPGEPCGIRARGLTRGNAPQPLRRNRPFASFGGTVPLE